MPRKPAVSNVHAAKRVVVVLFWHPETWRSAYQKHCNSSDGGIPASSFVRVEDLAHTPSTSSSHHPDTTSHSSRKLVAERGGVRDTDRPSLPETDVACAGARDQNPELTLHRYVKSGVLHRFVCCTKQTLTAIHKQKRLAFSLSQAQRSISKYKADNFWTVLHDIILANTNRYFDRPNALFFKPMYDVVHVDERWFNLYKTSTRNYLAGNEVLPYRSTTNKRYISKVMFLAAVARPRYDFHR